MSEFGNKFKQVREGKGLSLDQIAADTRINTRFLKAIEEEDFAQLPGGIVGRGFVRTYASCIKLDPEQAVTEFERLSQYREPPLSQGFRTSSTPSGKPAKSLYPVAAGLLILLIAVFYVVNRESNTAAITTPPAPKAAPVPPPVPSNSPAPAPASEPSNNPAPTTAEAAAPDSPTTPEVPAPAAATNAAAAPVTLDIEAREDTWIQVTVDDSRVSERVLHPGETRHFSANSSLKIMVGNAGGVHLKLNGHELPPLGQTGQVRTLTITPQTVKDLIP
jgi:cytoskeletal protein RodZ